MNKKELIFRMKKLGLTGVNRSAEKDVMSVEQFVEAAFAIPTYGWIEKVLVNIGLLADEETNEYLSQVDSELREKGM